MQQKELLGCYSTKSITSPIIPRRPRSSNASSSFRAKTSIGEIPLFPWTSPRSIVHQSIAFILFWEQSERLKVFSQRSTLRCWDCPRRLTCIPQSPPLPPSLPCIPMLSLPPPRFWLRGGVRGEPATTLLSLRLSFHRVPATWCPLTSHGRPSTWCSGSSLGSPSKLRNSIFPGETGPPSTAVWLQGVAPDRPLVEAWAGPLAGPRLPSPFSAHLHCPQGGSGSPRCPPGGVGVLGPFLSLRSGCS